MPSALSGIRGGLKGRVREEERSAFCHAALSGLLSERGIEMEVRRALAHREFTFVINNACNLACRHCYLQVDQLTGPELTSDERSRLVDSMFDQRPELICLSGKEVFLGNRGVEMLGLLTAAKKARGFGTRIGLITNGTLMHRHRDAIVESDLDYVDVSVDGVQADHDYNRGVGAFAAMQANLEWAAHTLGARLFVNMTLNKRNFERLAEAVIDLQGRGVQTVGCSFYHPLPYTDPALSLTDSDCDAVFAKLRSLGSFMISKPLTVLLEVNTLSLPAMLAFMRSEWFSARDLVVDERGYFYNETVLPNGIRLQVRFSPFPLLIFKTARITPEGNYIAAEDTIDAKGYAQHTLGNVRDFDFDLARLQTHAARSERLTTLLREYFDKTLPSLQEAYAAHLLTERMATESNVLALVSCPRNTRYIAGGQLAVFQGASEAPISESYGSSEQRGKTAHWPRPGGSR